MYRVTDLDNDNQYTNSSNFYDLEEAQSNFNSKKEKGLNVVLNTIKFKVLICESVIQHYYQGYDYYVNDIKSIDFIIQSLLLGPDHIELYKVSGDWRLEQPQQVIDVIPLLDNDYSIESILYHGFNKLYPQSSFLSSYLVKLLHDYYDKKINKTDIIEILDNIKSISFCKKQKEYLCNVVIKFLDKKDERND